MWIYVSKHSSFSVFQFVKFVKFFEILVFFFINYRYKLCTCVNLEIFTGSHNLNIPVLITACITYWYALWVHIFYLFWYVCPSWNKLFKSMWEECLNPGFCRIFGFQLCKIMYYFQGIVEENVSMAKVKNSTQIVPRVSFSKAVSYLNKLIRCLLVFKCAGGDSLLRFHTVMKLLWWLIWI